MSTACQSQSPLHAMLDAQGAKWASVGSSFIAKSFGDLDAERVAMTTLGLCDVSGLEKLGVKGTGAEAWLRTQNVDVPTNTFDSGNLADGNLGNGGLVVRLGSDEFLLESGPASQTVPQLSEALGSGTEDTFRVEHQDATLLLSGTQATALLAQTCGHPLHQSPEGQLIFTRVAGVSVGILPQGDEMLPVFRLWFDPGYAVFLWKTFAQISSELGGQIIGAGCFYPGLGEG